MKKIIPMSLSVVLILLFSGCGDEWAGGGSSSFGFITYTEPIVSEREIEDDSIKYTQYVDDEYIDYFLTIDDYTDYNDFEDIESLKESYVSMPSYTNVEETSVDGIPAVSYSDGSGPTWNYSTVFIFENETMKVTLFSNNEEDEQTGEGWDAYQSLLNSIVIEGNYSDDENDSDDISDEPSGTVGQENALKSAEDYLAMETGFSDKSLREQLEYEGYESEDIDWVFKNLEVDWKEQCEFSAKSYMESQSFSAAGLREQLSYEGFTDEQIEAGLAAVGY